MGVNEVRAYKVKSTGVIYHRKERGVAKERN